MRSTKGKANLQSTSKNDDQIPKKEANASYELFCCTALADQNEHTIYADLTGKFLVRSFKGNQYIFVCYTYNLNAILVWPMKTHDTTAMITAFQDIYQYLISKNYKPKLHVMDNECSKTIEKCIISQDIKMHFLSHINIVSTQRKGPYKHLRIISLQA